MAQYKISRGPRYGEIVHLPQSQEVHLALILDDIEAVPDAPPAPIAEPRWGVGLSPSGTDIRITLALPSGEVISYSGPADKAKDGFKRRVWSGEAQDYVMAGPEPPADVIAAYTLRKTRDIKQAAQASAALDKAKREAFEHETKQKTALANHIATAANEGQL